MKALLAVSLLLGLFVTTVKGEIVQIDPGLPGTEFRNRRFDFNDLNGFVVNGQTIEVDVTFPDGISAVYKYEDTAPRDLYGWTLRLFYDATLDDLSAEPRTRQVVPFDEQAQLFDTAGILTAWGNGGPGGTFDTVYYGNYNVQFFPDRLEAFTDTPYHGVHFQIALPDFIGDEEITGASFVFTVNGPTESTQILASSNIIPEPSALTAFASLTLAAIGFAWIRRRRG
jgi:hypothetical protein